MESNVVEKYSFMTAFKKYLKMVGLMLLFNVISGVIFYLCTLFRDYKEMSCGDFCYGINDVYLIPFLFFTLVFFVLYGLFFYKMIKPILKDFFARHTGFGIFSVVTYLLFMIFEAFINFIIFVLQFIFTSFSVAGMDMAAPTIIMLVIYVLMPMVLYLIKEKSN